MQLLAIMLLVICGCSSFPANDEQKLETDIRSLLDLYLNDEVANDISSSMEGMQSDQPTAPSLPTENILADDPITEEPEYLQKRHRARDQWRDHLMFSILKGLGRINSTVPENVNLEKINIKKMIHNFENNTVRQTDDSSVTEKIRSFYPSCNVPNNTDADMWKKNNEMNLFFDLNNLEGSIASLSIRLYRATPHNGTGPVEKNCENRTGEEEKLFRVSVFYYTKTLRKTRVKRRLCDSVVISEQFNWVELNLQSAIKAWSKGKNAGLAVVVDDQEGGLLCPEKIFKGPACTVGSSTPKPIPTVLLDPTRALEQFGLNRVDGGDATPSSALSSPLLPTLDVCTLDSPDIDKEKLGQRGCSLKRLHGDPQKRVGRMAHESLTMPSERHIRHQKQHLTDRRRPVEILNDPRSHIIKHQVVLTSDQLQNFNQDNFNLTKINR
ncbi:PREDICTED: uncharacterized protein LOC108562711 isoform X2 [Nicrophorus vespilloides]|uniref:Uncharacterized protein LOC108562711 isoform X2 n=1 Tax=Nicrophorus vespilloides TaxID=110193 RepID=A0ABM1MPW0_NICVS|nr:PREDICTED: uncharacterized protein LOC108562711 isoform X2 [Nicrophorus vespilloides]